MLMITEVQITEGNDVSNYAQWCPTNSNLQEWFKKVIQDLVLAPVTQRIVTVPGTTYQIDRQNITEVKITLS